MRDRTQTGSCNNTLTRRVLRRVLSQEQKSRPKGEFWGRKSGGRTSRAKKAHKHKEMHPPSPILDPTLKFFMWGPLLLENKGEGATHIKNLGLHWGRLDSLCGYFFMCFFRFLVHADIPANFGLNFRSLLEFLRRVLIRFLKGSASHKGS